MIVAGNPARSQVNFSAHELFCAAAIDDSAKPHKQSPIDRRERMARGVCPVHGGCSGGHSVTPWLIPPPFEDWQPYTIEMCNTESCPIRWKACSNAGPWELLPEWQSLLQWGGGL